MENRGALSWIYFVAKRFFLVDKKGVGALSSKLSTLGICFGVMTLIIVISVMNGFQREFIDAIMEVSSFHVRIEGAASQKNAIEDFLSKEKNVLAFQEFVDGECLAVGPRQSEAALFARGINPDFFKNDKGFLREVKILRGSFNLDSTFKSQDGQILEPIVLGSALARSLGAKVGDEIGLYSLNSKKPLAQALKEKKRFFVSGIFMTGYADINASYAFVNMNRSDLFEGLEPCIGVKLKNSAADGIEIEKIKSAFLEVDAKSWREYNRSFFGALKIEKNMLMLLVFLIFFVVAINIFNSMRRIVYERRFEISTLSALGGRLSSIKKIFVMRGFLTGVKGAIPGLILGMFFCVNIKGVFSFLSAAVFWLEYFACLLFSPQNVPLVSKNPMFAVYGNIPARMYAGEVIFITLFGILSAVFSSWLASREVLSESISEVLHDE